MNDIESLESIFDYFDESTLKKRIEYFQNLDFENLSYQNIKNEISKIIFVETPAGKKSALKRTTAVFPKETMFYRVRALPLNDVSIPLKSMCTVADCWRPPEYIINKGRLNKKGESFLYTTPEDISVPFKELKIKDNEPCSLIIYKAKEPINVVKIGCIDLSDTASPSVVLKANLLELFLRYEFTRYVPNGQEYLYNITESIVKDYYDIASLVSQDGWCYPSVVTEDRVNVCFHSNAESKLELIGVLITEIEREEPDINYKFKYIVQDSGDGINLKYDTFNSIQGDEFFNKIGWRKGNADDITPQENNSYKNPSDKLWSTSGVLNLVSHLDLTWDETNIEATLENLQCLDKFFTTVEYKNFNPYEKLKVLYATLTLEQNIPNSSAGNTALIISNMGDLFELIGDDVLAKECLVSALSIVGSGNDYASIEAISGRLGKVLISLGDYDSAKNCLQLSLKLSVKHTKNKSSTVLTLILLIELGIIIKTWTDTEKYFHILKQDEMWCYMSEDLHNKILKLEEKFNTARSVAG